MAKKKTNRMDYRYVVSGLDNVIIKNLEVITDENGNNIFNLKNINGLHKAISHGILTQKAGISPKDLKFVRTEMGMTQEDLAELLNVSRATINRWESRVANGHIDPNAEFKFRHMAAGALGLDLGASAEEISRHCKWSSNKPPIMIDGVNSDNYTPVAA